GVLPRQRLLKRRRRDVLRGVVENIGEGIALLVRPETVKVLVGPSSEQQGPAVGHPFSHGTADVGVIVGHHCPAAGGEAVPGVFVSAAGCCITPSRVRLLITTILLTDVPFDRRRAPASRRSPPVTSTRAPLFGEG